MSDIRHLPDLGSVFDASPFATLLFTPDLVLLGANARHGRLTGVPRERMVGRPMFEVFPKNPNHDGPDTEDVIRASVARVMRTLGTDEPPMQKHDLPRGDGTFEPRYWRMIHSPVLVGDEVVAIRQDAWDVTTTVQHGQRRTARQRVAGGIAGIAFWEHDVETDTMRRTPELDAIFGFPSSPEGLDEEGLDEEGLIPRPVGLGPYTARVLPEDATAMAAAVDEMIAAGPGKVRQTEYRLVRPNGEMRRVAVRGELTTGDAGQPIIVGTSLDVTELHANETRLESLLTEKEVLLGEVNHRVKNSLQLVSSILSLEARQAAGMARAQLTSAVSRVQAVAAVHASLYHDDDVRTVEFGAHLRGFVTQLAGSLGAEERGIALRVETVPTVLRAEVAVPLSLIVNELVTNAFKYAFEDQGKRAAGDAPRVTVSFETSNGTHVLTVADNGLPAARDAASGAGAGLGTRLVTTLARQIGGTIVTTRADGWTTALTFEAALHG